jgi:hypothetical protein
MLNIEDFNKPNILHLMLRSYNTDTEFNIDIGPGQLNNLISLSLSEKFNGNISPDSLINCRNLIFENIYESKYTRDIGKNQFPKIEKLILGNFSGTIDPTALASCRILHLGKHFNHPIVEKQFNSVEVFNLSSSLFNNTIHENALQNCKIFILNAVIKNEKGLSKNFMKSVETIILPRYNKFTTQIITQQQIMRKQKLNNNTSDLNGINNKIVKKQEQPIDDLLETGIFPNLKLLIINDNINELYYESIWLLQYLTSKLTSVPKIYFRKSSTRKYVQFTGINTPQSKIQKEVITFNEHDDIDNYAKDIFDNYNELHNL